MYVISTLGNSQIPQIRVVLLFKDQISADTVREQLKQLSLKVYTTIQPVFVSRKIEQELNVKESKPLIINQRCVVYTCVMRVMSSTHADMSVTQAYSLLPTGVGPTTFRLL